MEIKYILEFLLAGSFVVILDIFSKKINSKYSGIITSIPFLFLIGVYINRKNKVENFIYNCMFSNIIVLIFMITVYYLIISKNIHLKLNYCIIFAFIIWFIINLIFLNYIFK